MSLRVSVHQLRHWVKHSPNPMAKHIFAIAKGIQLAELPAPKIIYFPAYVGFTLAVNLLNSALRILVWTPMFKSRLSRVGKGLFLYGGIPYTAGALKIFAGDHCRISGKTTITGRNKNKKTPELLLGNNIDLGWMTTIAVGNRVVIEDNVRIAGQCLLAGYPGHPEDPVDRAQGLPETDSQVGDIVLEKDVWLGTGVSVMAGVTIGEGTIVGAASVVTKDLPAGVLAVGNPARVMRPIRHKKPTKNARNVTNA